MSQYQNEPGCVEAPQGANNLLFKDEKQQARFELGVSMMIYKWGALDVAVENQWGGPDSAEKRDWITAIIVDLFKTEKVVETILIEETLLYAMVDEFDTNVEDDSAVFIANGIIELYKQCQALDYSTVESLYLAWQEKQKNKSNKRVVQVKDDPLNPDVSDSEDEEDYDEEESQDVDMDVDEQQQTNPEPIIDEDGFEVVQKKGRRRY